MEGELNTADFIAMTRLHYRVESTSGLVEEELDHILIAKGNVELVVNPNEVEIIRWVDQRELTEMLQGDGCDIAPWFRTIAEQYLPVWWSALGDNDHLQSLADSLVYRF